MNVPLVSVVPEAEFVASGGRKPVSTIAWSAAKLIPQEIAAVAFIPDDLLDDAGFPVCGRPADRALVFPRARAGGPWNENAYRSWRRKVFAEAVASAKLPPMRPYDLRHSFASLLIAEGRSILEVAGQLGHAPTMTLDVHGHVIAELSGQEKRPAADLIAEARTKVREKCASASEEKMRDVPIPLEF